LRLLYAGQISADRGLHTIVEALGRVEPSARARMTLRVAGHGSADYLARVRTLVQSLGLADGVSFDGKVSHERMPALYREHDVLVFSSVRREGLPLTMVEAMLAGCAVVTTGAGGAREIAERAELPTFPVHDATSLADRLSRLVADRGELHRIAVRGQRIALDEFSRERMLARFEASLRRLTETAPGRRWPVETSNVTSRGAGAR
jgi:glycosyltransferase involved in cell wall biosynthesis